MGFDGTGAGYNPRTRKKHKNERPTFSYLFFRELYGTSNSEFTKTLSRLSWRDILMVELAHFDAFYRLWRAANADARSCKYKLFGCTLWLKPGRSLYVQ